MTAIWFFNMRWEFYGEWEDVDSVGFVMSQGIMKEYVKADQVGGEQLGDLETDGLCMLCTWVSVSGRKTTEIEYWHLPRESFNVLYIKLQRCCQGKSTVKR